MYNMSSVYNPRTGDHVVTVTDGDYLMGAGEYRPLSKTVIVNQYSQIFPLFELMTYFDKDDYDTIEYIRRLTIGRKELGL